MSGIVWDSVRGEYSVWCRNDGDWLRYSRFTDDLDGIIDWVRGFAVEETDVSWAVRRRDMQHVFMI